MMMNFFSGEENMMMEFLLLQRKEKRLDFFTFLTQLKNFVLIVHMQPLSHTTCSYKLAVEIGAVRAAGVIFSFFYY